MTGLADTLQAQAIFGDQTRDFDLIPAFGEDGVYEAVFIPTEPGDYTFRFFGQIDGIDVDETFTSSPEGFDSVAARADLEFPAATKKPTRDHRLTVGMPLAVATVLAVGAIGWGCRRRRPPDSAARRDMHIGHSLTSDVTIGSGALALPAGLFVQPGTSP